MAKIVTIEKEEKTMSPMKKISKTVAHPEPTVRCSADGRNLIVLYRDREDYQSGGCRWLGRLPNLEQQEGRKGKG